MSSTKNNKAYVENKGPGKIPLLHPGPISPECMRSWETACLDYFATKEIPADKRVSKVFGGILDLTVRDWIDNQRDHLETLTFPEFMSEFRAAYLKDSWEADLRRKMLALTMSNSSFWDYATSVQTMNAILKNTASYLPEDKLRHQIESGISKDLSIRCEEKNTDKEGNFRKWLYAVKRVDEEFRTETERMRTMAEDVLRNSRKTNTATSRPNFSATNATSSSTNTSSSRNTTRTTPNLLPKLTSIERQLLQDHSGCFKCRRFYANHMSKDCPNDYPSATSYRQLTQTDADAAAKHSHSNTKVIAAIGDDANLSNPSREDNPHPVAAIMGYTSLPIASDPTNEYCILNDENSWDSDDSDVSPHAPVASISTHISPEVLLQHSQHLLWPCAMEGPLSSSPLLTTALIDCGSHLVLIRPNIVDRTGLKRNRLHKPISVSLALETSPTTKTEIELHECVKLKLRDRNNYWTSRSVRAVIAPGLCSDVVLGLPFLERNKIVIDCDARSAIDKTSGFDLLHPEPPKPQPPPPPRILDSIKQINAVKRTVFRELKDTCNNIRSRIDKTAERITLPNYISAIRERIEILMASDKLKKLSCALKEEYHDVFSAVPHADLIPTDVYCSIKLKDANKTFQTRSYKSPRKYKEAWSILIQRNLDLGRIRPSNSAHASPAFLVPKSDPNVLPRWVNDYRQLNANTVLDSFPLPRVDDVLADCAKGKIWSKMDMTDSFFQTRVHPDDVPLTAVSTPLGLYEWLVMPQGLRNSPPIHQRRVTAALRKYIGKFCHIYLDDIIIWSNLVEEHAAHVRLILEALRESRLYCNPKKSEFFLLEVDFLGHHISSRGIEPNSSKVDKILQWPCPKSSTDVRAFLGIVRYIATFLPKLADHTRILNTLTTKEATKSFPHWTDEHQAAFDAIKSLVVSRECLTVIDHQNPGNNKIFVTCDASDWRTGAVLSYGPTWETARPVAFDSKPLKGAERNYPIHEKELLAIIRALKKWRVDLIGTPFSVYTDHKTLLNFESQRDLSRRQLRWQELMSQYDMTVIYIRGEDNTVADALSRLPDEDSNQSTQPIHSAWSKPPIGATLTISADAEFLRQVKNGYVSDEFCKKFIDSSTSLQGVRNINGLWYIGSRLLIPRVNDIREQLFRLAHDTSGHFGFAKSYAALHDSYYWPNMRRDLEHAYIPSCTDCQRNKSSTSRPRGPLHPLPIPDERGNSIAMDFIGPLPRDRGYDCILSITDCLGADMRIIPTRCDISADDLAVVFFDNWYCENGLPLEIVSDRDKLFISHFWHALNKLTGVKLKMSSAYHPQTDGSSERSNKTINQCIRYHVERNQKGWVRALPRIRFDIMNSVNASTGFSNFQLHIGRSPRLIPPLVPTSLPEHPADVVANAKSFISRLTDDVHEARDNLLMAKTLQSFFANQHRANEDVFVEGDRVMLATLHRRREYKQSGDDRVAKFFPRYDGPYKVTASHLNTSSYTLELPNQPNVFPTFHSSLLKRYVPNDPELFPSRELPWPGPIVTMDGQEEWLVERIIDSRRRGHGFQYLVRWTGYGPEDDRWLPARELKDCKALDTWLSGEGDAQR